MTDLGITSSNSSLAAYLHFYSHSPFSPGSRKYVHKYWLIRGPSLPRNSVQVNWPAHHDFNSVDMAVKFQTRYRQNFCICRKTASLPSEPSIEIQDDDEVTKDEVNNNCEKRLSAWKTDGKNLDTETSKTVPRKKRYSDFLICCMVESHCGNTPVQIYKKFHLQKREIFR